MYNNKYTTDDGYEEEEKEKQELHTDTKIIGSRFIFFLPWYQKKSFV